MAQDASDHLAYYLRIDNEYRDDLVHLRCWDNLKVGMEENQLWIKDFTYAQIHAVEVKSIPYREVFYARSNQLYPITSALPDRLIPSLLWTPIERALPVTLPSFNHNYFGIREKISVELVSSEMECNAVAMIISIAVLKGYMLSAPAVRLNKIQWSILDGHQAFLIGSPLLPINGDTYWQREELLLPSGFDFQLVSLAKLVNNLINPQRNAWVIWNMDNTYSLIPKEHLRPLSLCSFRLSVQQLDVG